MAKTSVFFEVAGVASGKAVEISRLCDNFKTGESFVQGALMAQ